MTDKELDEETLDYIEETDIEDRQDQGQYFTRRSIQMRVFNNLPDELFQEDDLDILDPGSGTGEFLKTSRELFSNPNLYGWELDEELVERSRKVVPEANIKKTNTLLEQENKKYDVIIGNPPYYEFQPSEEIKDKYSEVMYGRTNIYGLFIYKSIKLLKEGGYLGFVNPPSMNNGAYFKELRDYIVKTCNVEYLSVLPDTELFEGADQSVMILILRKGENQGDYVFEKGDITIFSEQAERLNKEFQNKKSLEELGFHVQTGGLIWNENKEKLTNDSSETLVVYSHNITEEGLELDLTKDKKKQYVKINNDRVREGPAILVNRVVGKPGSGSIRAIRMLKGEEFIAENHVNVITPNENNKVSIDHILNQLNDPENVEILQSITGNSQLSKTELHELFPIEY